MCLSNSASKSYLKSINFQYCVTRGSPSFYCCVTFSLANYEHDGYVEANEAVSHSPWRASFAHTTSTDECGCHCWEKAPIAREPSNEHDPYAIAVLENVGGEAAGGSGCITRLAL